MATLNSINLTDNSRPKEPDTSDSYKSISMKFKATKSVYSVRGILLDDVSGLIRGTNKKPSGVLGMFYTE